MVGLASQLAATNKRHSADAIPDPYHDVEQILMRLVSGDSDFEGEEFDGRSYTLHVIIDWLARRLWRQRLAPDVARDPLGFSSWNFSRQHPIGISRPTTVTVCWSRGQPANLRAGRLY